MAKNHVFRTTAQKFEEVNPTLLRYAKPCEKNHCDLQGRGVRLEHNGSCLACKYKMPDGPFSHDFGDQVIPKKIVRKYSEEEGRARHIQRVMEWQRKNKDKVKVVQTRYNTKEETRAKNRAAYQLTKEKDCERQRAYYAEHRDEILEKQREAHHKRRLDQIVARRKYQREQYWKKKAEKELELAIQYASTGETK